MDYNNQTSAFGNAMQKILLFLVSALAVCAEKAEKVFFSATIVNIQKIQEKYPDLPIERVHVDIRQNSPFDLMYKFRNPNTVSNGDIAYINATKEIYDDLLTIQSIKQHRILPTTSTQ
jgi:superfamily I DNA and/or RNA helicase